MRRLLALGLATMALLATAPGALANHSELLARWHLDTVDNGFTPDDSGHNLQGELNGGSMLVPGGRFGNALDLASLGDSQVDVLDNATLEPAKITVMTWLKLGSTPSGTHYVVAKGAQGCSGSSYALNTPSGGLSFQIYNGSAAAVSPNAGTGVWNDQWHAVAGTFDGATVRLYVDGTQVGAGTPASTSIAYGLTTDDLRIGNYPASNLCGGGLVFEGLIDETRVYNRALDADEIAFLSASSHSQPPNLPPPPTNTAAPTTSATTDPHPGDDLNASPGSWTGSPTSYSYQWLRCAASGSGCADIAGATAGAYKLTGDDVGSSIRVRVRATNASGTSNPADSVATNPVTTVPQPLAAKLVVSPNPSCAGSDTLLDGSGSTGSIARYRFGLVQGNSEFLDSNSVPPSELGSGASPRLNWVPRWNDYTPKTTGSILDFWNALTRKTTYFRTPADVTLTVTDTAGKQASTKVRVTFTQKDSSMPRAGCPPFSIESDRPVYSRARTLDSVKLTRTAARLTVPCGNVGACLGSVVVTYTGSLRAAARRRKPLVVAATGFYVPPGVTQKVVAKLTRKARTVLRARGKLRVKVTVGSPDAEGRTEYSSRKMTLRGKQGRKRK